MTDDEILKEVRAAKDAYARSHGYDLERIFADLRTKQAARGAQVVHLPPRRVSPEDQAAARRLLEEMTKERQKNVLAALGEVWSLSPNMPLGQLMSDLDLLGETFVGKRLDVVADEELVTVLHRHRDELKARVGGSDGQSQEGAVNAK